MTEAEVIDPTEEEAPPNLTKKELKVNRLIKFYPKQ